jgi:uncharacterized protein (DUF2147 family)
MLDAIRASLLFAAPLIQLAVLPAASAQTAAVPQIDGVWQAEDGSMKLEMFDAGGSHAGRLLYGRRAVEADGKTFKRDVRNPDPALRSRSLEGIVVLRDLRWSQGDKRWDGGRLYDGTSGRSYSARAALVNGRMELRVYMGSPMLGRTLTFQRVAS